MKCLFALIVMCWTCRAGELADALAAARNPSSAVPTPQPPATVSETAPGVLLTPTRHGPGWAEYDYTPPPPAPAIPTPKVEGQASQKPIVTLVTDPSWCTPCRYLDWSIDKYGEANLPFIIIRRKPNTGETVPRFYWDDWKHVGYEPIENFIRRWKHANSLSDSAKEIPEAAGTPHAEIARILATRKWSPTDVLVDFGCGDARVPIYANRLHGVRGIGIEIDPERAAQAASNVAAAGLVDQIEIVVGDATEVDVEANVGYAYLYPETLSKLKPKIERLEWFASYMHAVPGLVMRRNGDFWVWTPTLPQATDRDIANLREHGAAVLQDRRPFAVYQGQTFYGPCCDDLGCGMRQNIVQQLRAQGYTGR